MSASSRPVALVTAPIRGPGAELLRRTCEVIEDPWLVDGRPLRIWDESTLAARVDGSGASILVCEADPCRGEVLDRPLRVVASTRGDPTNVDVEAATRRGIPVLHAPGRNADGVAELTVALLLAVTRHVLEADADVRAGEVFRGGTIPYQRFRGWQIADRTVGLVGLGAVGRAARWRFEGLGMTVLSYDPYSPEATHSDLDDLLGRVDVVSMHAAATPSTIGLMDADRFGSMRDGAIFLNTAAGLHDLEALTAALASGKISAAGLDHFDGEQVPLGHPLLSMANVVLTPHIGGATYDTETNHSRIIAADVAALLEGRRPVHCVNPEVLT